MMLFRRRLTRLAEEIQFFGKDRQLACFRATQLTIHANDVTQIELIRELPILLANLALADEQLNAARPIQNVGEDEFAFVAQQHNPARGSHFRAMHLAGALTAGPLTESVLI